jgi:hypothetical protein
MRALLRLAIEAVRTQLARLEDAPPEGRSRLYHPLTIVVALVAIVAGLAQQLARRSGRFRERLGALVGDGG